MKIAIIAPSSGSSKLDSILGPRRRGDSGTKSSEIMVSRRTNGNFGFPRLIVVLVVVILSGWPCHGIPLSITEIPALTTTTTSTPPTQTTTATVFSTSPVTTTTIVPVTTIVPQTTTAASISKQDESTTIVQQVDEVEFTVTPQDTEVEDGDSVTLNCRTREVVSECQWSWQPSLPKHLPAPNTATDETNDVVLSKSTTTTSQTTSSNAGTGQSWPVRTFPSFGKCGNDCSVKFANASFEQAGYWTCAARRNASESFKSTAPAKLTIIHVVKVNIDFEEPRANIVEFSKGTEPKLNCTMSPGVKECQWYFRRFNETPSGETSVRRFPAKGKSFQDCSLELSSIGTEQEGLWTCGVRIGTHGSFVRSRSVKVLISEVNFNQLSKDVQTTVGENVVLRCVTNKPVVLCEWSMGNSSSNSSSLNTRTFLPNNESAHDCSLRFKKVVYEEEGLWTCGVKLTPSGPLHKAPPATLTLLPSGKINFTEVPESTSAAIGTDLNLKCTTNGRVDRCSWSWSPLNGGNDESMTREFPSSGELGRDCTLGITKVSKKEEGYWTCRIFINNPSFVLTTPPAKLTVYEVENVTFSELSQDIQLTIGGTVNLRCVTSGPVEQCRWSLTPTTSGENATVVVMQSQPTGPESRDCSVKLSHALAEQEGYWRCGAKPHGSPEYIEAPPAKLTLIEPEPIAVTLLSSPHQMVSLTCKYGPPILSPTCFWKHEGRIFSENNTLLSRKKYTFKINYTSGICNIQFILDENDLGLWSCEFIIDKPHAQADLGLASIQLVPENPLDQQADWLVGVFTTTILVLLVVIVIFIVYKTHSTKSKIQLPSTLETLRHSERKTSSVTFSKHEPRINNRSNFNAGPVNYYLQPGVNLNDVLPNRSPRSHSKSRKNQLELQPHEVIKY